jgi:hypothetical protein
LGNQTSDGKRRQIYFLKGMGAITSEKIKRIEGRLDKEIRKKKNRIS